MTLQPVFRRPTHRGAQLNTDNVMMEIETVLTKAPSVVCKSALPEAWNNSLSCSNRLCDEEGTKDRYVDLFRSSRHRPAGVHMPLRTDELASLLEASHYNNGDTY